MRTMGVDQSFTKTAIVILLNGELEEFHVLSSEKDDDIFFRCWQLTNNICDIAKVKKPERITIEGLSFGSRGNQTRNLGGLQFSVITRLRYKDGFENVDIIAPPTLKKFATGDGRAKKEAMIEAVPDHILDLFKDEGYKKKTGLDDLADAYWLSKLAYERG